MKMAQKTNKKKPIDDEAVKRAELALDEAMRRHPVLLHRKFHPSSE